MNAKFHLAAELRRASTINLREACHESGCDKVRHRGWAVAWDSVEVERAVGTRRPDLTLTQRGTAVAAIEVFATHAVDSEKAQALGELGLPWIEVHASEIVGKVAWECTQPLPVRKEGQCERWHCETCEMKQAERKKEEARRKQEAAEQERQAALQREKTAKALKNGVFSRLLRVVDLYHPNGRYTRDIYEILEDKVDGLVVAVSLQRRNGRPMRFEGDLPQNRDRLEGRFLEMLREFEQSGAFVDSPMQWLPDGANYISWMRAADWDRTFPIRYRWDPSTGRWRMKPEHDGKRWPGG